MRFSSEGSPLAIGKTEKGCYNYGQSKLKVRSRKKVLVRQWYPLEKDKESEAL